MRFLDRDQPAVSTDAVAGALGLHYGIEGVLTPLESERDLNLHVASEAGDFLFKVCNAAETPASIDLQIAALRHIAEVDPEVPVPRHIPTSRGNDIATVMSRGGSVHRVRLMTFLDGRVAASEPAIDTASFRHNTGVSLARLDRALRGFFHPAADQDHPWDLGRVPRLLDYTVHIEDDSARRMVVDVLRRVRDETLPAMSSLRSQVIHQDAHTHNLIVDRDDPSKIVGIIDFGDLVYGPLINELAVASYLSGRADGSPRTLVDLVLGYDSVIPLEPEEVAVLYDMVLARIAMGLSISSARAVLSPGDDGYGADSEELTARLARAVDDRDDIEAELRRSLGLPSPSATTANSLLARRRAVLGEHAPHFYASPLHVVSAAGVHMEGGDGRAYLDFYNNVPVVGHSHPRVLNAVSRQMALLNTNTRYLYLAVVEYGEALLATMGHELDTCVFVNSGSEANDVAARILKLHTGAAGLLVVSGSYHGITEASSALTTGPGAEDAPNVSTVPPADRFRHPDRTPEEAGSLARNAISGLRDSGHGLAGFFVDPAMTSNGIPSVPEGYLGAVADVVRAHGGLVVSDEVQAGFGRTGFMWGHQRERFAPDVVTLGKPIGNGFPMGAVVSSKEIIDRFAEETGLFSTFGGNPVACAAGMAVLGVLRDEDLIGNANETGAYLRESLEELGRRHDLIGDVRGTGLLVGLEFVSDRQEKTPAVEETDLIIEGLRERGVLVGPAGRNRNVLKLRPPLVVTRAHVDELVEALDSVLVGV